MHTRHLKSGFSLIDTLLGVGIFLVVTVALIQFTLTTLRAADNLDLQLRAQNAAREAAEIMESIRGTNAMSFVSWENTPQEHPRRALAPLLAFSDLKNGQPLCVTVRPQQDNIPWKVQKISCPSPNTPPTNAQLLDIKDEKTGLTRYIRLQRGKESPLFSSFWSSLKSTSQAPQSDDDILDMEIIVGWENRGQQEQLVIRKILTDWY